ncbi:UDP-N-acetylmuramoyl-tripeptide--D-alanyl-D-alanine ligase [Teichococcus oryzae]|uniref:UDP-N-acetylmuramoyl-tripeptide--D-alanyl-D-alanine ligase n=1 Tax=Teichococcus oryzae TaxID=1608942 RepID=A0A5B2TJU9_9PROT|nr:UDP-N-acetylmuramoyl-tripeptide--D-alanyl-D-alanine ligase [Pseudoroseomonas oryzae]KAA2214736.1 UDP-N-acetylmuramoyl-tripeptide--D-alanyl-D-alanine ligase [Pseudoroseomonas oryzae]
MSAPLWTAAELRDATGGRCPDGIAIHSVGIDSRNVVPGELFVALRDARDGHDFVADALARGAAMAMVDRDPPGVAVGAPLLRVGETLAGLQALGAAGRARSQARIAAITGSVGKTTTKEMLRHALSALGPTHAAVASYNNHWGLPLTLARMPRDAAFGVLEIGMNHRGEIAPLARLARPHVAAITTVEAAHIGHLGSIEEIAEEKADIMQGLAAGSTVVLPRDSAMFPRLLARAEAANLAVLSFGQDAAAEVRLLSYDGAAESGVARIAFRGSIHALRIDAPGRHLAVNACGTLAVASALGVDPAASVAALDGFRPGAGRGGRVTLALDGGSALLIDDSYNGQPAAMRAGLGVLGAQAGRRIAVLGDMRELGEYGPALHAGLLPDVLASADLVFCCGPQMRVLYDALPEDRRGAHRENSDALAPLVRQAIRPGDAILVKGSLGSRMAVIVRALTAREGAPT